MRILIVVYSFTGNNLLLARHLAQALGADLVEVREPTPRTPVTILLDLMFRRPGKIAPLHTDPQEYDHVLFLAPLWNRRIATPMRTAMRRLAPRLGACSFATLCGGDRAGQSETVRKDATAATGRPPTHQKEIWLETQRPVTAEDLARLTPQIDEILGWFAPAARTTSP